MKKIICIMLAIVLLCMSVSIPAAVAENETESGAVAAGSTIISLTINSPIITINGVEKQMDEEGTVPMIDNGKTLVPLRAIFEALSAEVEFDAETKTIYGKRGSTEVELTLRKNPAYVNGEAVYLETLAKTVNGRTMVPLRFIAESLGAEVTWIAETKTINITKTETFMKVGDVTIFLGDSIQTVESLLGKANRVDESGIDYLYWHVYNSDYSKFIMVGIYSSKVVSLYSNAKGFETNFGKYGDAKPKKEDGITFYIDEEADNTVHACLIMPKFFPSKISEKYLSAQERQNFDVTNVFRVNHGLKALRWDDVAALTSRQHSQDMADRDYFGHNTLEGVTPWERYQRNGGNRNSTLECIYAGASGIETFHEFVNIEGIRKNMLTNLLCLGVGCAFNASSTYGFYITQYYTN